VRCRCSCSRECCDPSSDARSSTRPASLAAIAYVWSFDSSTGVQANAAADAGPTVFAVLQEQLVLRLEPSRVPEQFLIIDSIEAPTEN